MSKLLGELGIKLDSGEQFGIYVKRIFKKKLLGKREILEICLGSMRAQIPWGPQYSKVPAYANLAKLMLEVATFPQSTAKVLRSALPVCTLQNTVIEHLFFCKHEG